MAEWGIKVSQPNKDVNTCDDKDLVFSTDWNTPKIIERGSITLTVAKDGYEEVTINHNYGWIGVLVYAELKPNKYYFADSYSLLPGENPNSCDCSIEENSFTIDIYNGENQERTFNITYFLLRESIG